MSSFKSLRIRSWRQFASVDIDFHRRLTVLTGANGAGKTTILHLINRFWGWNIPYVSSPRFNKKGFRTYWSGFWDEEEPQVSTNQSRHRIGEFHFHGDAPSQIFVPDNTQGTFSVTIEPQHRIPGVYVPSHRPIYLHQPINDIPTTVDAREQIFEVYLNSIRSRWSINQRVTSPSHMLQKSIISLATFGYGNPALIPNDGARQTFEGFEKVLSVVLPRSLGFQALKVQVPDVVLQTRTGNIAFDAVSGGIAALIDIGWQVFLYSTLQDDFTVVIDEPEVHLHPTLQREIMPNLLEAFPRAQFIIATHNPLVIGSVRDSDVYVLDYDKNERVRSERLDHANKAATANEILRDVLGLQSTSAVWVDADLERLLDRLRGQQLTESTFEELRQELRKLGLSRYLPEAIDRLK